MADLNAVLAGLRIDELEEIKVLGPKGHLGRHLMAAGVCSTVRRQGRCRTIAGSGISLEANFSSLPGCSHDLPAFT